MNKSLKKQTINNTNFLLDYYHEYNKDMKKDIKNNSLFKQINLRDFIFTSLTLIFYLLFNIYVISMLNNKNNDIFYENKVLLSDAVGKKERILGTYHFYTQDGLKNSEKKDKIKKFNKKIDLDKYIKDLEISINLEENINNVKLINLLKEELKHAKFVKEKLKNFDMLTEDELLSLGLK